MRSSDRRRLSGFVGRTMDRKSLYNERSLAQLAYRRRRGNRKIHLENTRLATNVCINEACLYAGVCVWHVCK